MLKRNLTPTDPHRFMLRLKKSQMGIRNRTLAKAFEGDGKCPHRINGEVTIFAYYFVSGPVNLEGGMIAHK